MRTNPSVLKRLFSTPLFLMLTFMLAGSVQVFAQPPANDGCATPQIINIASNGFDLGTFNSVDVDITEATVEASETFAPAILVASLNQKSIWYKFTLPTTRSIRVTLSQPGLKITAGDVGFAVYKSNTCLPATSELSTKLTPIATFGNTYHPCVEPGEYLIQVSAKNAANGPVSIKVETAIPSGSLYDQPANAYEFGALGVGGKGLDFNVDCLSLDDENETCPTLTDYKKYTKSAWFTFSTPAYFDYIAFLIASPSGNFSNGGTKIFGYNLYKGDARSTPVSSLTIVDGCDTLATDGYYPDWRQYTCSDLETSTTYTIQLFFHEDFYNDVRIALSLGGYGPTSAPSPVSTMPASNKLGVLAANSTGLQTYGRDYLGCNSRLAINTCEPSLPASGLRVNGTNWNLSTFFTFTLASTSAVTFYSYPEYPGNCGPNFLCRLYKQDVTADCKDLDTNNIITTFNYQTTLDCMEPGNYTLQVMGVDTAVPKTNFNYGWLGNRADPICMFNNLGAKVYVQMNTLTRRTGNRYDLSSVGAFDTVNAVAGVMQPLMENVTAYAQEDTFGCNNTLMPDTIPICSNGGTVFTKAIFREFVVKDSGVVSMVNKGYQLTSKLYRGSASRLAAEQGKTAYPETIEGLTPYSPCMDYYTGCGEDRVCAVPDTFSFAAMGTAANIANYDKPGFRLNFFTTTHRSPALAQDMGNIIDTMDLKGTASIRSDNDYFTCIDNLEAIPGYTPCNIGGAPATKVIYRQFYLKQEALLTFRDPQDCQNHGYFTLFTGKVTDVGVAGLTSMGYPWECFTYASNPDKCKALQPGWYTVIAYGTGPTFENPLSNVQRVNEVGSHIGYVNYFSIDVTKACVGPQYNRPFKASINKTTNQPHLFQWGPRVGHTSAYPKTDTTYTLPTEYFNCTIDTPFAKMGITACAPGMTKVVFYVFRLTQQSYVQINTNNAWAAVYDKNVRTADSLKFMTLTPVQTCMQSVGQIQICRMLPGTYTLVLFTSEGSNCGSVTPSVYIDQVGYSRFDHAAKAYDFGKVPPDSAWHAGKVGAVNPLNGGRKPSNDFFYCTTGAQKTDPTESTCYTKLTPSIYNTNTNNALYTQATRPADYEIAQRNLWYTFVVDQPGWVNVKVSNMTIGKGYQQPFAIYKSDESGTIPFATLQSTGKVDSTTTQGLEFVGSSFVGYYCASNDIVRFYRDPCNNKSERYYIVVTNRNPYAYADVHAMQPNSQVEVSVLLDSIIYPPTKFDHYSFTNNIGNNLGVGTYDGAQDNFSCATVDPPDPVYNAYYYAKKTLWYKFSTTVTGHVRFGAQRGANWQYDNSNVQLFREAIPGDSTVKGLIWQSPSTAYDNVTNKYWSETCVSPGTYYLILTGYQAVDEYTKPSIQIREDSGDFCSAPVVLKMPSPGKFIGSALVDCHTIGTDYGEFGPNLTCPENAKTNEYKSTWYRLDVEGKDTLDITVFLDEQTNAGSADIKYRLMTGNCGAMQEQSCVQDALTRNTYECLTPGSYYIQVLTPVLKNGAGVNGVLNLNVEAKLHSGLCAPVTTCLVNANFIPQFDCTKDTAVRFVNYSTFGTDIKYKWDFGYNSKTSAEVSPGFFYPALTVAKTYTITLTATNTSCNKTATATATVTVPARPYIDLGPERQFCTPGAGIATTLDATSWPGATYAWNTGSTDSAITVGSLGRNRYDVAVTYNGCVHRDTVYVFVNPIASKPAQRFTLCAGESATLNANRGYGEIFKWSNGSNTNQITVGKPDLYWVDVTLNGCTVRDSFYVDGVNSSNLLGADRAACFTTSSPYKLDATTNGATSYTWQNGSTNPIFNVKAAGKYWVRVDVGNCTISDTVFLTQSPPITTTITGNAAFCQNGSTVLDGGAGFATYAWSNGAATRTITVTTPGNYRVTVTNGAGCSAVSKTINVKRNLNPKPKITGIPISCNNVATTLDAGANYTKYSWTTGQNTQTISTAFLGKIIATVTDSNSCVGKDSVTVLGNKIVINKTIDTTICLGNTYKGPSGKIYSVAKSYFDTIKAKSGCDSLITTINLKVFAPTIKTVDTTICAKASFTMPAGVVVTKAGTYKDTLKNKVGCDSLITTVRLKIFSPSFKTIDTTICDKASYKMPAGAIVKTAGTYVDTLKNKAGCDSLITTVKLKLFIATLKTIDTTICDKASFTMPAGAIITKAGIYKDTLKNKAGCDSLITTVNLKLFLAIYKTIDTTICAKATYTMPGGTVISKAGKYTDTLKNKAGCDSLITTVNLKIFAPTFKTIDTTICAKASFTMPGGLVLTKAGNYRDTLKNNVGCDSLITTVRLKIFSPSFKTVDTTICDKASYTMPGGAVVTKAGTYVDTLKNNAGCDSLITTVKLKLFIATLKTIDTTICDKASFTMPAGAIITKAGAYTDTLKNKAGCDSLITTVNLKLFLAIYKTIDTTICAKATYNMPGGAVVSKAGKYTDTLKNNAGCDSIITTVNLKVFSPIFKTIDTTICDKVSYTMPAGSVLTKAGTYVDTLKNNAGCDSVITTVKLKLFIASYKAIDTTICDKASYTMPAGAIIKKAGTYTDTLKNKAGCDSLISTVTVKIFLATYTTVDTTICEKDFYTMPAGQMINKAGTYKDTLKNNAGCDSLITTVNLKVFPAILRSANPAICLGSSYTMPSGATINTAGIYKDTIRAKNGCDSLITTVTLAIKQPTKKDTVVSICAGTTYKLPSGQTVSVGGVYTTTVTGSNGCDSVITTTLTIGQPLSVQLSASPSAVCLGETTLLTATATGGNAASYQYTWQPAVSTTNTATVSPIINTTYKVTVTDNCSVPIATASTTVAVNPLPTANFSLVPADGCIPLTVKFVQISAAGTQYAWVFGDGENSTQTNPSHVYTSAGTFTVSLNAETAAGCKSSYTLPNAVRAYAPPVAAFETTPSPNFAFNRTVEFFDRSTGATSWVWSFGDRRGTSTQRNPTYSYQDTGSFATRLIVKNENNCADTANLVTVISGIGTSVYIPNAFTPNNDGKNDFFRVFGANIRTAQMAIYNRYGEKVYDGDGFTGKWNGQHMKNGQECISGAYIYAINVTDKLGIKKMYKGTVMLIR